MKLSFAGCLLLFATLARPQDVHNQIDWKKLAARATGKVDINLEGPTLEMASKFLGGNGDQAQIKKLVDSLQGVYVKSFEFDREGQYSMAEVKAVIEKLQSPAWSKLVDISENNGREIVGVYLMSRDKRVAGLVVIAAEPKELTFVNIVGPIDLAGLTALGGTLGIPNVNLGFKPGTEKKEKKDEE